MRFTKKDLIFSIITGLTAGVIFWRIFTFLGTRELFGIPWISLVILVPILWILGVNLGYFLGKWIAPFNQFGKFASIGFTNAAVDFGILNFLIAYTGIATGWWYSGFKSLSFLGGVLHSYVWNKFWVFDYSGNNGGRVEFFKFSTIAIIAFLINVGVASAVVNLFDPMFGLSKEVWANLGGVAGSAVALIFSFIGFKMVVFKKNDRETIDKQSNVISKV